MLLNFDKPAYCCMTYFPTSGTNPVTVEFLSVNKAVLYAVFRSLAVVY